MTGLGVLTRKEVLEQLRTYRLLIVAAVFVLFGLATPLLIKFLPELMELSGEEVQIQFPEPTALQAIGEYAGTMGQVGLLTAILIAMGAIAREREQGTAALTLSKPVSRAAFVVAKLLGLGTSFGIALLGAAIACYAYTVILFGGVDLGEYLLLNLLIGEFLLVCLAVTLLCSSLFRNQLAAGGLALALLIGQAVASGLPWVGRYSPGALLSLGIGIVRGEEASAAPTVVAGVALVAACLLGSWLVLRRKEL